MVTILLRIEYILRGGNILTNFEGTRVFSQFTMNSPVVKVVYKMKRRFNFFLKLNAPALSSHADEFDYDWTDSKSVLRNHFVYSSDHWLHCVLYIFLLLDGPEVWAAAFKVTQRTRTEGIFVPLFNFIFHLDSEFMSPPRS